MPLRNAVDPTRATMRDVKSLRRTRAADAAAPTAMNASLRRATSTSGRFRYGVPASGHASAASPSDPANFDDGALLVATPTTQEEGEDDHADGGHDQAGLGGTLGDLGGVVGHALDLGELGLD